MANEWASDWEDKWEDEYERMQELNELSTELMLMFDDYELVDSELLNFLGSVVNHFFGELIAAHHPPNMIRFIFEDFAKKIAHGIEDAVETREVIKSYENSN